jgi:hypothetical protein
MNVSVNVSCLEPLNNSRDSRRSRNKVNKSLKAHQYQYRSCLFPDGRKSNDSVPVLGKHYLMNVLLAHFPRGKH